MYPLAVMEGWKLQLWTEDAAERKRLLNQLDQLIAAAHHGGPRPNKSLMRNFDILEPVILAHERYPTAKKEGEVYRRTNERTTHIQHYAVDPLSPDDPLFSGMRTLISSHEVVLPPNSSGVDSTKVWVWLDEVGRFRCEVQDPNTRQIQEAHWVVFDKSDHSRQHSVKHWQQLNHEARRILAMSRKS